MVSMDRSVGGHWANQELLPFCPVSMREKTVWHLVRFHKWNAILHVVNAI